MIRTLLFFLILQNFIIAQDTNLYIPLNIQKAYAKDTRSFDGKPGKEYWQNNSHYKIKVNFNPSTGQLTGSEKITYYNESPDSLDKIVIRLYQNITKPDAVRDFDMANDVLSEGVNVKRIIIDKAEIDLNNISVVNITGTNMILYLPEKMEPDGEINLEIDWNLTIQKGKNPRMGYYGDSTYFVGYWYPQVAVYDDIDGWDRIEYTGQAEFYNDFSNYEVEISVPKGITVWSTGVLKNAEEIFLPEYLKRYNSALTSDTIIKIFDKTDLDKDKYIGDKGTTWKYEAENVPDFAFAVAGRYLWDAAGVQVDESTNRRVLVSAAYNPLSRDFYEVADIACKTIEMLSKDFPGVPFPYPCLTVFNGGGGMEYPMMVNDGSAAEHYITVHVTSHEITHTYFPFYMGTNERKYAWMDEGWAVMLPFKIQSAIDTLYDPVSRNALTYQLNAGKEIEVPPITPSYQLKGTAYRLAAYNRPAEAYKFLRETLGEEKFDNALREYMKRWNGKHPVPYDFFFTFDEAAGENLSWFWKPWFFEDGYPDLGIKEVKIEKTKINVLVEKKGNIPIPVYVNLIYKDGSELTVKKDLGVWKQGNKEVWVEVERKGKPVAVELGNNKTPDVNPKNNFFYIRGDDAL